MFILFFMILLVEYLVYILNRIIYHTKWCIWLLQTCNENPLWFKKKLNIRFVHLTSHFLNIFNIQTKKSHLTYPCSISCCCATTSAYHFSFRHTSNYQSELAHGNGSQLYRTRKSTGNLIRHINIPQLLCKDYSESSISSSNCDSISESIN